MTFQQISLLRCDEYGYACWPALFNIPLSNPSVVLDEGMSLLNEVGVV